MLNDYGIPLQIVGPGLDLLTILALLYILQ